MKGFITEPDQFNKGLQTHSCIKCVHINHSSCRIAVFPQAGAIVTQTITSTTCELKALQACANCLLLASFWLNWEATEFNKLACHRCADHLQIFINAREKHMEERRKAE